jgi:tripartite-type tricarboxylate transporter receptor subunit TctC
MKIVATATLALGLAIGPIGGGAEAQKYRDVTVPSTIEVIVAYAAGGGTDILVRTALPHLEAAIEELAGRRPNIVVRNIPGAGGEVGWVALTRARADGSTIGIINLPAIALVEAARKPAFAPWTEKLVPIGVNVIDPNILIANDRAPGRSLRGAIEQARRQPGSITIGADGPLSDDHLAVYALEAATGAKFTFIPYSGGAPAQRAFLSKEVELMMGNVSDYMNTKGSAVDSMIFWGSRYDLVPEVPTTNEALGRDVGAFGSTRGWAAPAGVPPRLLELYREAFALAMVKPAYVEEAKRRQLTLVEPRVGDAFGEIMRQTQQSVQELLQLFRQGGYIN